MELASILIAAAILIPAAAYIARPLVGYQPSQDGHLGPRWSKLQAEKDRILDAIQELDMDRSMGKVPREHYQLRREALISRGIQTLKELDEFQPSLEEQAVDRLEADIQLAVAQLRSTATEGLCPQCETKAMVGDLFCSNCGTDLALAEGRD